MKYILSSILLFVSISLIATKSNLKQVVVSQDVAGFNAEWNHIVARAPTVTVEHRMDANTSPWSLRNSNTVSMSNSNTSTLPNVGSLGKTAEIIYPHVDFISKTPVEVKSSAPAQIGSRVETTEITSVNKANGKVEKHEITKESPIMGTVGKVDTLYHNSKTIYDVMNKRLIATNPTLTTN